MAAKCNRLLIFHRRLVSWRNLRVIVLALLSIGLTACNDMVDQPRYDPLEPSTFFADGRSSRPMIEGVVAQGIMEEEPEFYTGRDENGDLVGEMPVMIDQALLERGQERYDIYCAPCHGLDGYGQGIIVQRGFPPPQSLHLDRLRRSPDGYYFEVITNGFGRMYAYDYRVKPPDRWAIVAYIRALQLSQFATPDDVPPENRPQLEGTQP
jgi:hypothetical protein